MNVEFVADSIQIWKNDGEDEPDYDMCFTRNARNGVYVTVGMSAELMEHLRQWLNNIHDSRESANNENTI